jgi:hypothetical protein
MPADEIGAEILELPPLDWEILCRFIFNGQSYE